MAQILKQRRSSVEGKVPTTSDLSPGELAINTYDGRIFFEKNGGSAEITQILTANSQTTGSLELVGHITASGNISGSSTSTGSFGHILKGGVNWDTAVSTSAATAGFSGGGGSSFTSAGISGSWQGQLSSSALTYVGGGVSGSSTSTGSFGRILTAGKSLFNNQIWVNTNGSATVPSINVIPQGGNGFYKYASNEIGVAANGASTLRISSTAGLEVLRGNISGSSTSTGSFGAVGVGTGSVNGVFVATTGGEWNRTDEYPFQFINRDGQNNQGTGLLVQAGSNSSTTKAFTIQDYSGNDLVNVDGAGNVFMPEGGLGVGVSSITSPFTFEAGGSGYFHGASAYVDIGDRVQDGIRISWDSVGDRNGTIQTRYGSEHLDTGNITSLLLQPSGGFVGIGVDSPSTDLDISGSINFSNGTAATSLSGSAYSTGSFGSVHAADYIGAGNTTPGNFYQSRLVVGDGSGEENLTIYAGAANYSGLFFANATSGNGRFSGQIYYHHGNNKMQFAAGYTGASSYVLELDGNKISGSSTSTGSFGSLVVSDKVQGNLIVDGNIEAKEYIISSSVTYMTSSFSSGSTIFGDTLDDTHKFTGSLFTKGTGSFDNGVNATILTAAQPNITSVGTLQSPTIVTPTIASFANATHTHANAAGGGQITLGTGTTGNYVATAVAGDGIDVSGATGNVTITAEDSTASNKGIVIVAGGTGISVGYSGGTATVTGHTKYAITDTFAAGEVTQLQNIGATTISATQWGYLGAATGAITNTNTTYTGGTNLTLSGTTFNVDDAFLKNDANDTTSGTLTSAGFISSGNISGSALGTGSFGSVNVGGGLFTSQSLAAAQAGSDNLGNHIATQNLNMNSNNIFALAHVTASGNISGSSTSTGSFGLVLQNGIAPATVGGSNTQVLFNDGGIISGEAELTYNKTTNHLSGSADSTGSFGSLVVTGTGQTIFNGGNVGIGTQTEAPEQKLHVMSGSIMVESSAYGQGRMIFMGRTGHQYEWYVDDPGLGQFSLYNRGRGGYDLTFAGGNATFTGTIGSGAITSTAGISGTTGTFTGNILSSGANAKISGSSTSTGSFGYLNVTGDTVIGGNLTFGDADTDTIVFDAEISSSFVPDTDNMYDLGSPAKRWQDLYAVSTTVGGVFEVGLRSEGVKDLETGTVLVWSKDRCAPCIKNEDELVMGVSRKGKDEPIVLGAEPILVTGKVDVGDYIVSSKKIGHGKAVKRGLLIKKDLFGKVIAQALEAGAGDSHTVKAMIRKM